MKSYKELVFTIINSEDFIRDILIDELSAIGFDTFEETDLGFKAYIPSADFDEEALTNALSAYDGMYTFEYHINLIPYKNWNEVWESNFEAITIGNKLHVRATFHPAKPEYPLQIVIDPKMSFGTGHHETTYLMAEYILQNDFKNKSVLDMGCGTAILAILASKMGATDVTAVDIDEVCVLSAQENAILNNVRDMIIYNGDIDRVQGRFDVILANINRNILLTHLSSYASMLVPDGELYLSGFYEDADLEVIQAGAAKFGLKYISHYQKNNWAAAKFVK